MCGIELNGVPKLVTFLRMAILVLAFVNNSNSNVGYSGQYMAQNNGNSPNRYELEMTSKMSNYQILNLFKCGGYKIFNFTKFKIVRGEHIILNLKFYYLIFIIFLIQLF